MNIQISGVKKCAEAQNLLILSSYSQLGWTDEWLDSTQQTFVKRAAEQKIAHVVIPRVSGMLIVQFLAASEEEAYLNQERIRMYGSEILSVLKHYKIPTITVCNMHSDNPTFAFVEGMLLGSYQFLKYFKNREERLQHLSEIQVSTEALSTTEIQDLVALTEAVFKARDLVNEPQSYLTAAQLSEEIEELANHYGLSVQVLKKEAIEELGMGGLLAVNKGSIEPPRFNILEWKPEQARNQKPLILVGKGITYDTGGLSLKPTANSMDFMKSDMAGAAAVIGAMIAAAKAQLPIHVIALIPSTDNRPGENAYAPGDVIKMYDGSTVEVLNTDAEGRMVMADALHYAKQYDPGLVMDFATLTGSAVRAVGPEAICYMGTADRGLKQKMESSGFEVYERLIEFPLWKEYGDQLRSNIADIKNIGGPTAGMITAGKFLEHFTDFPWLHFDIAGSAYLKSADGYRPKEGTGVGVRLLFNFFKKYI